MSIRGSTFCLLLLPACLGHPDLHPLWGRSEELSPSTQEETGTESLAIRQGRGREKRRDSGACGRGDEGRERPQGKRGLFSQGSKGGSAVQVAARRKSEGTCVWHGEQEEPPE